MTFVHDGVADWVRGGADELPVLILTVCLVVGLLYISFAHQILSAERRLTADVLVIEGWLPDAAFDEALEEAARPEYHTVMVVGGADEVDRKIAIGAGLSDSNFELTAVYAEQTSGGNTIGYASEVRDELQKSNREVTGVHVFTIGPHARKSHIVFRRVLSPVPVGVLRADPVDYDARRWWASRSGWRWVVLDTIKTVRAMVLGYWARRRFNVCG